MNCDFVLEGLVQVVTKMPLGLILRLNCRTSWGRDLDFQVGSVCSATRCFLSFFGKVLELASAKKNDFNVGFL